MRPRKYRVELTKAERKELEEIVSKGKSAAIKIKHAHILLKLDESEGRKAFAGTEISKAFDIRACSVSFSARLFGKFCRRLR